MWNPARRRHLRRGVAVALMVTGVALMLLSPSVGPGLAAFGLGLLLELVGIALDHRASR